MFHCHFVPVLLAFVVLGLVSSVLTEEVSCEERLRNNLLLRRVGRKTFTNLNLSPRTGPPPSYHGVPRPYRILTGPPTTVLPPSERFKHRKMRSGFSGHGVCVSAQRDQRRLAFVLGASASCRCPAVAATILRTVGRSDRSAGFIAKVRSQKCEKKRETHPRATWARPIAYQHCYPAGGN